MKQLFIFFILLIVSMSPEAQVKLIKADSHLDVRTGKLVKPANIVIEDGMIKSINPKDYPDNVEVINLGNQILLPGLIDTHVHLYANLVDNYQFLLVTESASKGALRGQKNAEKTLMAGFTTVRDVGQIHPSIELINVALAEASDNEWIAAPRIIPCGHRIGISGGHSDHTMIGGFAEEVMNSGPEYGIADGKDEVLKATRYQIKHGAKAIKIVATAGVFSMEESVGAQQLTYDEMETIVQEAERHDLTVAAHAIGTDGIIEAVRAGVTSIEHGNILSDEAIQLMIEKGTYLVPTSALWELLPSQYDKMSSSMVAKAKLISSKSVDSHKRAIEAGVKIALGTDAPLLPHGKNAMEITVMTKRGMSPIEAIQSATIVPAEMLNLDDRGEIKQGFLADIIAVNINPLEDIKTLENVRFVMKDGKIYKNEN